MGSFKLKLVVYFSVISLLPFAAAFSGLEAVTDRNETRRVDGILETGVRAGLVRYADEVADAQRRASDLARSPAYQRALARHDRPTLRRLLANSPNVRIEDLRGRPIGRIAQPATERGVVVRGRTGRLGRVVVGVPLDGKLAARMKRSAGIGRGGQVALVRAGWITASSGRLNGPVGAPADPNLVDVGGREFRALASEPLPEHADVRLVVLSPQARIDESTDWAQSRIFMAMLVVLALIALVAYLEGRSIVRSVAQVADAARGIARGRLGDRVGVRGRDEFASLGHAFNEMADQLEARMRELEEERRRARETTLRFGEALAATHDVDQLLRVIVESAVESTGAALGRLVDGGEVLIEFGTGDGGPDRLEFPLAAGRENFGSLILYGNDFSSDHRESAGWLVGHAVIALANAQRHRTVEQQALVDGLTGLANRRLCTAALEKELARAERFGEPLALVLVDIDDFKRINDRWGHPTGDEVLKLFAKTLHEGVREIDLAGRWGGEEFALLLPETDLEGGRELAERVRRKLARKKFLAPDGERIRVTASFGVAAFPDAPSQDQLVAASDGALYEAKRAGKNQVAIAAQLGPKVRV